jgi:hypothetical protein
MKTFAQSGKGHTRSCVLDELAVLVKADDAVALGVRLELLLIARSKTLAPSVCEADKLKCGCRSGPT